jgi:hypothetical protein
MSKSGADTPLPGAMPGRTPENAPQPADFRPRDVAKTLLRTTRAGTLATIDRNTGHPFGSLVNVATDADGSPIILVSRLATHTANLELDRRASLLLTRIGPRSAAAFLPAIPGPSSTPALPTSHSGGCRLPLHI